MPFDRFDLDENEETLLLMEWFELLEFIFLANLDRELYLVLLSYAL